MTGIGDPTFARMLHLLGIVFWIGGVFMAAAVLLPAVRSGALGQDRLAAFQAIKRGFRWPARAAMLIVGFSGFYMVERLDLWARFADIHFWWLHAMVVVWLLFFLMLFVAEPLVLRRYFPPWARRDPARAFATLHHVHTALLILALVTICGAVAGVHG